MRWVGKLTKEGKDWPTLLWECSREQGSNHTEPNRSQCVTGGWDQARASSGVQSGSPPSWERQCEILWTTLCMCGRGLGVGGKRTIVLDLTITFIKETNPPPNFIIQVQYVYRRNFRKHKLTKREKKSPVTPIPKDKSISHTSFWIFFYTQGSSQI